MKIKLKSKLINHLLKNGNKETCEITVLKSFKSIQKTSKKPFKTVVQLAVINSSPLFRLAVLKKKRKKKEISKEIPKFVTQNFERISWGLKYVLFFAKKPFSLNLYNKLKQEFLVNAQNKGNAVRIKTDFQKQAVKNKRVLLYFRW